jgi:diguanylate cyclase (GGDEF)-like protein
VSRRVRPGLSGPRLAALRALLGPEALMALLPGLAATVAAVFIGGSEQPELTWLMVGLCTAAGAYALLACYGRAAAQLQARNLDSECRHLAEKCSLYLARARVAEGNIEGLALIREIHRTGNVADRSGRFRGILAVVAQAAEAERAELFVPAGPDALPALGAVHGQLADAGLFVYFDPPLVAGSVDAAELSCRRVAEQSCGERRVLRGEVCLGKDAIGFLELALGSSGTGTATPRAPQGARELLEAQLRSLNLDASGAEEALEHRQVFRVHDGAGAALIISYPLMAEGAIIGAMRLRLPTATLDRRDLTRTEELLQETAGHVGLVVKKDEDVERARHDGLTGLLLKTEMLCDLRKELASAGAGHGRLSLLMVDIDHFKAVNDKHGHLTGDSVLRAVATCLASHVRSCDRAYRYGGEEMAVLLPGADEGAAGRTAERLRRAIARLELISEAGQPVPVTISLGIADVAIGEPPSDIEEMISRADQALYFSKESGRNRTSVWRPGGALALSLPRGRSAGGRSTTRGTRSSAGASRR